MTGGQQQVGGGRWQVGGGGRQVVGGRWQVVGPVILTRHYRLLTTETPLLPAAQSTTALRPAIGTAAPAHAPGAAASTPRPL